MPGVGFELRNQIRHCKTVCIKRNLYLINYNRIRTQWTTKGNRDAGSSCSWVRGLHRYHRNFGEGGEFEHPKPPLRMSPLLPKLLWYFYSVYTVYKRDRGPNNATSLAAGSLGMVEGKADQFQTTGGPHNSLTRIRAAFVYIQGVTGGKDQTSGGCSLC